MIGPAVQRLLARREALSIGGLFAVLMTIAVIGAGGLSWVLLRDAARDDAAQREHTVSRMVAVLRDGGLSGLSLRLDALDSAMFPESDRVELALWQLRNGVWRVRRASSDEFVAVLPEPPTPGRQHARIAGRRHLVVSPDIAALSRGWNLPMSDVALSMAFREPGGAVLDARRLVAVLWIGVGFAFLVGVVLLRNHERHYRLGLARINVALDRFCSGDTAVRIEAAPQPPELVRLAGHLNTVLPRLGELIHGLRHFSAGMAHELKTPLQVIRGTLDRLPDADDAAERAEIAAQIDRVIDQANARVTSLMQLFRLEALAEIPMAERLDLGAIADGAVEDLADLLETRGRTVRVDLAPGVRVSGNRALLDLMVSNLLTNAQKYAPDGAAISVALERRGAAFRLSVANTGSSFPADIRARAFERFARARADADRPGSGIGLSLVRAIVERHGFSVEIPEIEGQAVVVIEGPCAPAREGEQS